MLQKGAQAGELLFSRVGGALIGVQSRRDAELAARTDDLMLLGRQRRVAKVVQIARRDGRIDTVVRHLERARMRFGQRVSIGGSIAKREHPVAFEIAFEPAPRAAFGDGQMLLATPGFQRIPGDLQAGGLAELRSEFGEQLLELRDGNGRVAIRLRHPDKTRSSVRSFVPSGGRDRRSSTSAGKLASPPTPPGDDERTEERTPGPGPGPGARELRPDFGGTSPLVRVLFARTTRIRSRACVCSDSIWSRERLYWR